MNQNPYEVLGLRQGASQEEIRAAYLELAKKYHPDQYQNHPLQDMAQSKMQEINEAYDYLTRKDGSTASSADSYQFNRGGSTQGSAGWGAGGQTDAQGGGPQGFWGYGGANRNDNRNFWAYNSGASRGCCGNGCCENLCMCFALDSCCECMGGDLCTCC